MGGRSRSNETLARGRDATTNSHQRRHRKRHPFPPDVATSPLSTLRMDNSQLASIAKSHNLDAFAPKDPPAAPSSCSSLGSSEAENPTPAAAEPPAVFRHAGRIRPETPALERNVRDWYHAEIMEPCPSIPLVIKVGQARHVSGLLLVPDRPKACVVLAHGAGAGMSHPFMNATAASLFERRVATLRYQFPYMEQGLKRPDPPPLAHATVRAAVDAASRHFPNLPLFAGGKSFGGRMTSQAQAATPLSDVRGLAFLGFPLHTAGKPSVTRAEHLFDVQIPMLFLQGDRDALAQPDLIRQIVERLGERATLVVFPGTNHSFHVRARSGSTDETLKMHISCALSDWIDRLIVG
jgi:predicted alpha/beta-hydrolase family hydrolase